MPFIPNRNRTRNAKWFEVLEEGLRHFLNEKDGWLYNFEYEIPQPKKQDIEARYLSQCFFSKLMQSVDNRFNVEITDSSYMYLIRGNEKTMFHFDVMNNPKESHAFGRSIKKESEGEWRKWRDELYHTIGNFTPVPWPVMKYGNINMQDIHKGLDERWDLFLKLCQSGWPNFEEHNIHIDFQTYIKLTCQEIYFAEIYNLCHKNFGERPIEELSNKELLDWYDTISAIDLSNKEILTFGENLSNDVGKINRLIAIRGKLMTALASSVRESGRNQQ